MIIRESQDKKKTGEVLFLIMKLQNDSHSKILTSVLFVIYLIVLTWIIVFKMSLDLHLFQDMNHRSINLIPFAGSLIVNGKVELSEIILNIVVFIPAGVYMGMLFNEKSFLRKIIPIFIVSLLYEVLQYIFAIGASDITDLIGNTLGGAIGILLYDILQRILGKRTIKILNILAVIGTVLVIGFLGLLIVANM